MPPPLLFRRQKRVGDSSAPSDDAASEKVAFASDTYAPASHALTRLCWRAFAAVVCSHGPKATEEVRADIVARHERWLGRIGERAGHLKVRSHERPHYRVGRILNRPSCRRSAELEVETNPVIRRNPSLCTPLQSAAASLPAKPHFSVLPFSESGGPNRSAPSASSSDTASDDDERAMQVGSGTMPCAASTRCQSPLVHDAMTPFAEPVAALAVGRGRVGKAESQAQVETQEQLAHAGNSQHLEYPPE